MKLKFPIYFKKVQTHWAGIAMGDEALKFNSVLMLNESGYDIAKHLNEEISREELIARVAEEYDDTPEVIGQQVDLIIQKLTEEGVLDV